MSQKRIPDPFLGSYKPAKHTREGKGEEKWRERGGRKEGKRKKWWPTLSYYINFANLLDGRGLYFGSNFFQKPWS